MTPGLQLDGSYLFSSGTLARRRWLMLKATIDAAGFKLNLDDGTFHDDDFLFQYLVLSLGTVEIHLRPMNEAAKLWLLLNLPDIPEEVAP